MTTIEFILQVAYPELSEEQLPGNSGSFAIFTAIRRASSARSLFSKKQEWLRGGSARGRKLIDNMKEKQKTGIFSHKNSERGAMRDVITLDKSLV